ncbi:hypothetical protein VCEDC020_003214B, partial [Vibrio cholerae O1 str. EDC-020]
VAGRRQVSKSP